MSVTSPASSSGIESASDDSATAGTEEVIERALFVLRVVLLRHRDEFREVVHA